MARLEDRLPDRLAGQQRGDHKGRDRRGQQRRCDRRRGSRQPAQAVIPIRPISPAPPMSDAPTSSPSGKQATASTAGDREATRPARSRRRAAARGPRWWRARRDEHRVQMGLGDRQQADERAQDQRAQPDGGGRDGEFHDRIVTRKPPGAPSPPNDGPHAAGGSPRSADRIGARRRTRPGQAPGGRVPVMTNTHHPLTRTDHHVRRHRRRQDPDVPLPPRPAACSSAGPGAHLRGHADQPAPGRR